MNQNGARRAVVKLLRDYQDVLVYGFVHQGQQREIKSIYKSAMSALDAYYHMLVQVETGQTQNYARQANESKPHRRGGYEMTVHIVDAAIGQGTYVEPYELMDEDFRELCDRVEALVTGSYHAGLGTYASYFQSLPICIADPNTESKFGLPRGDRQVRVINLDHTYEDPTNEVYLPLLYSQVKFTLEEEWER